MFDVIVPPPRNFGYDSGLYRPSVANHFIDDGVADCVESGAILDARMPFVLEGTLNAAFNKTLLPEELCGNLEKVCANAPSELEIFCGKVLVSRTKNGIYRVQVLPNEETSQAIEKTYDLVNNALDVAKVDLKAHKPTQINVGSFQDIETAAIFAKQLDNKYSGNRRLAPVLTLGRLTGKSIKE